MRRDPVSTVRAREPPSRCRQESALQNRGRTGAGSGSSAQGHRYSDKHHADRHH